MTNNRFFKTLFGDSSYIVHYLRCLGYDLSQVEQTGSNFGTMLKHDNPYLSSVGSGTMVADGLSIINADFSSTSFRVSRVSIGPHNFLGNSDRLSRAGQDGRKLPARDEGHGSDRRGGPRGRGAPRLAQLRDPAIGQRDTRFDHLRTGDELRRRLRGQEQAQRRHDGDVPARPVDLRVRGRPCSRGPSPVVYGGLGAWAIALASVVASRVHGPLLRDWSSAAVQVFLPLRPLYCSIYDRRFWRHERFWKAAAVTAYVQFFNGTPFKNVIWRMLGVRIGRRVFDDGCGIPERTLVDDRRRLHPQRRLQRSSATRRRTAPSSPTASRSAPAARSGSAPGSTTA